MNGLNPKERLLKVLCKESVDRPPVICPGGMMNAAVVDVMNASGHTLPAAHSDAAMMAALAAAVHQYTGFENLGIPFCMTAEAEVLGSTVDCGTISCEPKIVKEIFSSAADASFKDIDAMLNSGRIQAVAKAAQLLAAQYPAVPVAGNLTGPVSAAASIIDPMRFLKDLRKNSAASHRVMDYVTAFLIAFATLLIDNGVTLISIADPTATGEILGPKIFNEYALTYLNKLIDAIHAHKSPDGHNIPVIVHICGDMNAVKQLIPAIKADAISTDAVVNLRQLKEEFPGLVTMGNLSTYLLEFGPTDKIISQTKRLAADGINIISPACGLSTSTAIQHIQAMTDAVKSGKE